MSINFFILNINIKKNNNNNKFIVKFHKPTSTYDTSALSGFSNDIFETQLFLGKENISCFILIHGFSCLHKSPYLVIASGSSGDQIALILAYYLSNIFRVN